MASTSEDEDQGIIRCICEFTHDDGFTIQCEQCFVWQHAACVEIDQNNVPEKYLCEECYPRYLDHRRAHEYQLALVQEDKQKRKMYKKRTPGKPGRKPSNPFGLSNNSTSNTVGRRKKYKTKNSPSFMDVPSSRVSSDEFGPSEFITYSSPKVQVFVEEICSRLRKMHPSLKREDNSEISTPQENTTTEEELEASLSLISEEDLKSVIIVNDINPTPTPQISSSSLNGSTGPRAPRGLFIKEEVESGRLVMECKGELSFKSLYKQSIGNLYLVLGTPQPQVLFHPNLDLILDCRGQHHPSKFIRNKCSPNAELRTFIRTSDTTSLHLGIFATKNIEPGEEVCVPWSFCQEIFPSGFPFANPQQLKTNSITSFETAYSLDGLNLRSDHFDTLLRQIKRDNCYCNDQDDCVVNQFFQYRRVFWDSRPKPRLRRRSTSFSVDKFPKKSYPTSTDFNGVSRDHGSRAGSPDSDAQSGDYTPSESHIDKFSNSSDSKVNSPTESSIVVEEKKIGRRPGRPSKSSKLATKGITKKVRSSSFIDSNKIKTKLEVELFGTPDNHNLLYDSGKSTHSSPLDVVQTPDPPISSTISLIPCSVFNKNEYSCLGLKKYWKTRYMDQVQKQTKSDLQSNVVIDQIDVEDISLSVVETDIEIQKPNIKPHRSPTKHFSPIKRTAENSSHSPKSVQRSKSPAPNANNTELPNNQSQETLPSSSKDKTHVMGIPSKRRNSQSNELSEPSKTGSLPKYSRYNDEEPSNGNFRGNTKSYDSNYSGNSFYSKPNHYKREYSNGNNLHNRSPSHEDGPRSISHKSPHISHSLNVHHNNNWNHPNSSSNNDHRQGGEYDRRHNGWSDRFGDEGGYQSKKKLGPSHFNSNRSYNDWNKISSNHSSRPYKYSNGHHNDSFSSEWNSHSRSAQPHHRYMGSHGDMRTNIRNQIKIPKYNRPLSHNENYSPPNQSDVNTNTYS